MSNFSVVAWMKGICSPKPYPQILWICFQRTLWWKWGQQLKEQCSNRYLERTERYGAMHHGKLILAGRTVSQCEAPLSEKMSSVRWSGAGKVARRVAAASATICFRRAEVEARLRATRWQMFPRRGSWFRIWSVRGHLSAWNAPIRFEGQWQDWLDQCTLARRLCPWLSHIVSGGCSTCQQRDELASNFVLQRPEKRSSVLCCSSQKVHLPTKPWVNAT